jgi:excisionase family DNA binding protein
MSGQNGTARVELLTIDEVAARLTVSRRSVERLLREGRLRCIRPSPGRVAITETELRAYLAYLESRAA